MISTEQGVMRQALCDQPAQAQWEPLRYWSWRADMSGTGLHGTGSIPTLRSPEQLVLGYAREGIISKKNVFETDQN